MMAPQAGYLRLLRRFLRVIRLWGCGMAVSAVAASRSRQQASQNPPPRGIAHVLQKALPHPEQRHSASSAPTWEGASQRRGIARKGYHPLAAAWIVLLAVLFHTNRARAAPSVWVQPATDKVLPGTQPQAPSSPTIYCAGNEFCAFQVVLRDPASAVIGIAAMASALTGPSTIPAAAVRFYQVGLVPLSQPSDSGGWSGMTPDPLIPALDDLTGEVRNGLPFNATAGDARAVWVEILVPTGTPAGTYQGSITVSWAVLGSASGQRLSAVVHWSVRVWSFALPSTPTLQSMLQVDDQLLCIGHYGSADCGDGWGPRRLQLLDVYTRLALDHRLSLGGSITYPYPRGSTGTAAWAPFMTQLSLVMNGTAATRLAGAKLTSLQGWQFPALTPNAGADFVTQMTAAGWLGRTWYYVADEPPYHSSWSDISATAAQLHQLVPGMRGLVTTTLAAATANGVAGTIDLLAPIIDAIDTTDSGDSSPSYAGRSWWTYCSCQESGCGAGTPTAYPTLAIDAPGSRNAALPLAAVRYGAAGFLYWQTVNSYSVGAGGAAANLLANGMNGDGTLFYPGTPGQIGGTSQSPVASQRLKLLREGVQLAEYAAILKRLGAGPGAQIQLAAVLPHSYSAADPDLATRMLAARQAMGAQIEALMVPPVPPANSPVWIVIAALAAAGVAGAAALLALKPKA